MGKFILLYNLDAASQQWEADVMQDFALEDCIRFLQRLIQTQSLPGKEEEIAVIVHQEMKKIGFDEVLND